MKSFFFVTAATVAALQGFTPSDSNTENLLQSKSELVSGEYETAMIGIGCTRNNYVEIREKITCAAILY